MRELQDKLAASDSPKDQICQGRDVGMPKSGDVKMSWNVVTVARGPSQCKIDS